MIDFDVITGPGPSEKPREPAPKPVSGREQRAKAPNHQAKASVASPNTSGIDSNSAALVRPASVDISK
jgi:hypothetical protein